MKMLALMPPQMMLSVPGGSGSRAVTLLDVPATLQADILNRVPITTLQQLPLVSKAFHAWMCADDAKAEALWENLAHLQGIPWPRRRRGSPWRVFAQRAYHREQQRFYLHEQAFTRLLVRRKGKGGKSVMRADDAHATKSIINETHRLVRGALDVDFLSSTGAAGRTFLSLSVRFGAIRCARLLLKTYGADVNKRDLGHVNRRDSPTESPLEIAVTRKDGAMEALLRRHGALTTTPPPPPPPPTPTPTPTTV